MQDRAGRHRPDPLLGVYVDETGGGRLTSAIRAATARVWARPMIAPPHRDMPPAAEYRHAPRPRRRQPGPER
jgi:hypothetical protein